MPKLQIPALTHPPALGKHGECAKRSQRELRDPLYKFLQHCEHVIIEDDLFLYLQRQEFCDLGESHNLKLCHIVFLWCQSFLRDARGWGNCVRFRLFNGKKNQIISTLSKWKNSLWSECGTVLMPVVRGPEDHRFKPAWDTFWRCSWLQSLPTVSLFNGSHRSESKSGCNNPQGDLDCLMWSMPTFLLGSFGGHVN